MVKKMKPPEDGEDPQSASAVRSSAQQIWQAGLGAFARAQEEGGRVFSALVKEGSKLQKRQQAMGDDGDAGAGARASVGKVADGVGKRASGSWNKLEQVFEERVSRALASMGVPTRRDISDLNMRLEELSKAVAQLTPAAGPAVRKARARAAPAGLAGATATAAPSAVKKTGVKKPRARAASAGLPE